MVRHVVMAWFPMVNGSRREAYQARRWLASPRLKEVFAWQYVLVVSGLAQMTHGSWRDGCPVSVPVGVPCLPHGVEVLLCS